MIQASKFTAICWVIAWVCCGVTGCGDPLYQLVDFSAPPTDIVLTASADASRYDWPLTRNGYVVAKPPQMAYVTSFSNRFSIPDPVAAELVPWSDRNLDETAIQLLHDAYDPPQTRLNAIRTLPVDSIKSPLAFDVSINGQRLVTIESNGIGLYKMSDGSLIGHTKLPVAVGQSQITAVRFCGESDDMLIASPDHIFRISSKDGSVIRQSKGCEAELSKWIVTPNDSAMIMLTADGKLFGGDSHLEYFSEYSPGRDLTFDDVGLSIDGTRITVVVDGVPRTYLQDDFQIIEQRDFPELAIGGNCKLAGGVSTDGIINGKDLAYIKYSGGKPSTAYYGMFWKPLWISSCTDNPNYNWFLAVGSRFRGGVEELVLFEHGPTSRNHSVGHLLDEMPQQIRHSQEAGELALLDSRGLHIVNRRTWQTKNGVFLSTHVYKLVDEGKFDQIKIVYDLISQQHRLGYGLSPSELANELLREVGMRWKYLETNDADSEILVGLKNWYQEGSHLALTASGIRHFRTAWDARGTGTSDTVSREGWQTFGGRMKLAVADLDKAVATERPSMAALSYRISAGLNTSEGLEDVDPLCRKAAELYPDNISIAQAICIKLLPQWMGESGDTLSFALSSSQMREGADGELMYANLIGGMTQYVYPGDRVGWNSYDPSRALRGVDEWIRRDIRVNNNLWFLHSQCRSRLRDSESADRILSYIMASKSAPPWTFTHGDFAMEYQAIIDAADNIRGRKNWAIR